MMKFRNKILAGFFATVLILSMTVGTALAADNLPAAYDEAAGGLPVAGQTDGNDVWIKITGSGTAHGNAEIANVTRSAAITISGNATFDLEFIYNSDGGWAPAPQLTGESVDGSKVYNFDMDGTGTNWCEAVLNLRNKSEGPLEVTRIDFLDEAGAVVLSVGSETASATETSTEVTTTEATPKTGVVSTALFLGLGATVFGTGALVLKKKED
jgi:LPXTG-motif cell wall-anchored protein